MTKSKSKYQLEIYASPRCTENWWLSIGQMYSSNKTTRFNAKPNLGIYADDVEMFTVANLEVLIIENSIFCLNQGLSYKEAKTYNNWFFS